MSADAARLPSDAISPLGGTLKGRTLRQPLGFRRAAWVLRVAALPTWEVQNPELNGYTAIMAYLPSRRISLALALTRRQAAAATGTNYSQVLFKSISEYLTPDHPVLFPG
jgi:hypothetical protein